jgi:hypothetical protein
MTDPHRGTRAHVEELLGAHDDAASLLRALTGALPSAGTPGT